MEFQLSELFKAIGTGTNLPAWASPAVQKVSAIMAQRGLGASSMASAAMTQAIMESAIPIAAADAKTYSQMELVNLSNEQAATMQNAMVYASMDRSNLDARMNAATNNARNFLSIDLANLTSQQKVLMDFEQRKMIRGVVENTVSNLLSDTSDSFDQEAMANVILKKVA